MAVWGGIAKNSAILAKTSAGFRNSHSQISNTLQRSACSETKCCWSRLLVRSNLGFQYSRLDFGKPPIGQCGSGCQCQKQPLINITALWRGSTKSGMPGKWRLWRRNRYPRRWTIERTASSGFIPRERMRDMHHERSSGVRLSMSASTHDALGLFAQLPPERLLWQCIQ